MVDAGILVGSRYQVQWGNARQVAEAVVLARVSQDNMKDREIEEVQINRNYSMAALATSTQPTARRGRVHKNGEGNELECIVAVGQGQVAALISPVGLPAPVVLTAGTVTVPAHTMFDTVSLEVPAGVVQSACPDCILCWVCDSALTSVPVSVEVPALTSPVAHSGRSVHARATGERGPKNPGESHNLGHFACLLVSQVFPKLFGPENLHYIFETTGGNNTVWRTPLFWRVAGKKKVWTGCTTNGYQLHYGRIWVKMPSDEKGRSYLAHRVAVMCRLRVALGRNDLVSHLCGHSLRCEDGIRKICRGKVRSQ
ncbi:hypothetical protein DPMN_157396 [Dreissena polymorpha]|uniref:Uncharacterized protein n=1 Tax=Dreissena polymorpha TaxID=45954 RepID=A0A9D4EHT6_DREPO|nr:hypothetical protein DPMN_157396 [Dreissena polymorpha]